MTGNNQLITAFDGPSDANDGIICLATTTEVLWLDERYLKRPLLACRHGRTFDRTIAIHTHVIASRKLLILLGSPLTLQQVRLPY